MEDRILMKRKLLNFFISILPAVFFLLMEYAVTFGAMLAYMVFGMSAGGMNVDDILDKIIELASDPAFSMGIMIIYECFIILAYGFWHIKVTEKSEHCVIPRNINTVSVIAVLVLSIGMVVVTEYVTMAEDLVNPAWYDVFEGIMEDAGMAGDLSLGALLYASILAPIGEELIFRGLVFHYSRKAFPVWIAIIYQAILFGTFHMNMFQAIYAFFAGLFLGFVAWYGGNIAWSILFHMAYNTIQSLPLFGFLDYAQDNYFYFMIILTAGVLVCMAAIFWYKRGIDHRNEENAIYEDLMAKGYTPLTGGDSGTVY